MTKLVIDAIMVLEAKALKAQASRDMFSYGTYMFAINELKALIR